MLFSLDFCLHEGEITALKHFNLELILTCNDLLVTRRYLGGRHIEIYI